MDHPSSLQKKSTIIGVFAWALALWWVLPVLAGPPDTNGVFTSGSLPGPCRARLARTGQIFASADAAAVQQAVDRARDGDLVQVAGYCGGVQLRGSVTQTVCVARRLTLQGGYASGNWSTPNPTTHPTTLDALGLGRVVFITGTPGVTLADLTVTNGWIAGHVPMTETDTMCPAAVAAGGFTPLLDSL